MKKLLFLFLMISILIITASCSGNKLEGTKPPIPVVEIGSVNIKVARELIVGLNALTILVVFQKL